MTDKKAVKNTKEEMTDQKDERKNVYCRKVLFHGYRNLGLTHPAQMTINRSLDPDKLGGLIELVGPNNCGKSNVIDGIESIKTGITERDFPAFENVEYIDETKVELVIYDGEKRIKIGERTSNTEQTGGGTPISKDGYGEFAEMCCTDFLRELLFFDGYLATKYPELRETAKAKGLYPIQTEENIEETLILMSVLTRDELAQLFEEHYLDEIEGDIEIATGSKRRKGDDEKQTSFPYEFPEIPFIGKYVERPVKQEDLMSPVKPINDFMRNVLGITFNGTGVKKVYDAYEKYQKRKSSSCLTATEEKLKEQAEEFSRRFNDLYFTEGLPYRFSFRLMDNSINLEIYQGNEPIYLDMQSTGFKWFFNFFFNFLGRRELKPGDIVLMDEPAINLHPSGQQKLREFLRKTAIATGVTFIISTHSPFLIDCNYLDEVRVVSHLKDGTSTIHDKFTVIDNGTIDKMDQILRSLTVGRHVMVDPDDRLYFVEGITDYNYLTAFKQFFGIKGISFMPINGLGDEEDTGYMDRIISGLMKIERRPVLIVDNDPPGKIMKDLSKNTGLDVITLGEIDGRFHTMESLFKAEDRDTYIPVKEWHASSIFKQYISEIGPKLSKYTIDNFRKVFDYLERE